MILVLRDEKSKMYFSTNWSFIWKISGYGIYIQLPIYIETS